MVADLTLRLVERIRLGLCTRTGLLLRLVFAVAAIVAIVVTTTQLPGWWKLVLLPASWVMGTELARAFLGLVWPDNSKSEARRG